MISRWVLVYKAVRQPFINTGHIQMAHFQNEGVDGLALVLPIIDIHE